ncbi:hypothetical protein GYH30_054843 [Glycine max]|nr:hypothetical protein GYH30_054843 [Glycine max]
MEKYIATMRRSDSRPVTATSVAIAACYSLNCMLRFFISFTVRGNSQSRSMSWNPKVHARVMVELMKVARAVDFALMREKRVALELVPPMEMRVVMVEPRVVVNFVRFVAVEFETCARVTVEQVRREKLLLQEREWELEAELFLMRTLLPNCPLNWLWAPIKCLDSSSPRAYPALVRVELRELSETTPHFAVASSFKSN